MSYHAPHPVTVRETLSPVTIDELVSDPSRAKGLVLESVPELLTQLESRVVPEPWVREQARLGSLPSFKLGHYVRLRLEEVERYLAERANQAA